MLIVTLVIGVLAYTFFLQKPLPQKEIQPSLPQPQEEEEKPPMPSPQEEEEQPPSLPPSPGPGNVILRSC